MKRIYNNQKIAIVYDWVDKWGGVERVLLTLNEIFPQADFFTSYFDLKTASWARDIKLKSSFLQRFPNIIKKNRLLSLPFFPIAFETFDFSNYDYVISITSSFAKGIITKPNTYHLCYLLTPTRFLWLYPEIYGITGIKRFFLNPYLNYLKKWDYIASHRPDKILAISKTVADRCFKFYHQKVKVVYPPFDFNYWMKIEKKISYDKDLNEKYKFLLTKPFFLVVSRLEPYKRIDIVINVFKKYYFKDFLLVIVGTGSQVLKLKKLAGKNILFFSFLTDKELAWFYQKAEALIMPQEEDFGYVSLEAQFFGCPVMAFGQGGAKETVIDGKTGIFFNSQTEKELFKALERFHIISYNLKSQVKFSGKDYVKRFDKQIFKKNFVKHLNRC